MTLTTEATTTRPLPVPLELATAEAVDVTLLGQTMETVDIGPFDGCYFRVSAFDLVVEIDNLRRLLDQAEEAVLDARQERMMADRRRCYCGALLDIDEPTCGALRCSRELALDGSGLA